MLTRICKWGEQLPAGLSGRMRVNKAPENEGLPFHRWRTSGT